MAEQVEMMENLSAGWILLGIVILIAGPGGAAWVGTKVAVNGLSKSVSDLRTWMLGLEARTREVEAQIREVRAVQTDRDKRREREGE